MSAPAFTPVAAGVALAGLALIAVPTLTPVGLFYIGAASVLLASLPIRGISAVALFILGALLVDRVITDLGPTLFDVGSVALPKVEVSR